MYIKRVSLQDFGRLTGTMEFSRDKCNVICQHNEFGKTTILDAVLYALYNFPTTGFSRDTLKPKDRYRPWNGSGRNSGFVVELELHDVAGRNYQLRADFNRQQPFTLHDADTLQPIPLDGMTFGQRYLRMPLPSFTQCFFLRQDEREGAGRNQLVSVIEEAAISNRREAPSNVSQALERLASPRTNLPGFCDEKILTRNLLKRLQDQKTRLTAEIESLRKEMDAHRHDVETAGELDAKISQLQQQIEEWELDLMRGRRQEKQVLLNRYNEGREALEDRRRLLEQLEPFGSIEVSRRSEIISVLSDWKLARQRLEEVRNSISADVESALDAARQTLSGYPDKAAELSPADLETLRNARSTMTDRQEQAARMAADVDRMEAELRSQGVPMDRLAELQETARALTTADREIIFEHTASHTEAQAALVALSQNALHAREQVAKAKGRRSWFASLGMGLTGLVVAFMVVGIVLLLTGSNFFGWVSLIAAAVVGAGAMLYITAMRARVSTQELEPAIQTEMALAAESRKIQEQLDAIESEYNDVLQRLQLTPDRVAELRDAYQWQQAAAAWSAGRTNLDRVQTELDEVALQVGPILRAIGLTSENGHDPANPHTDAPVISQAITRLENYLATKVEKSTLEEKLTRLTSERDRLESDFSSKEAALTALVDSDVTRDEVDLERKAQTYLDGCEKAMQLQTLRQEYGSVQTMTPEEAEALEAGIVELDGAIAEAAGNLPAAGNETLPGLSPDELERRLAQARRERDDAKERRNRGFREAEKAVNEWRSRGPALEENIEKIDAAIADTRDFAEACELAQTELANIANEVYTQWATALNERVNHVMPLLNDRYTQVALSQELDLSVFSREANRRLETRDIQHLSKGARDQLLLAVRIAIAEYLSAHVGSLPLALDEPFAHWDDTRFTQGMQFLGKLADRHQVLLLSCHGWRYDQLRETEPGIYDRLHFAQLA